MINVLSSVSLKSNKLIALEGGSRPTVGRSSDDLGKEIRSGYRRIYLAGSYQGHDLDVNGGWESENK